ncbi:MAG: diaminopimelate decarboxylase [Lachnospiraceae bacterium]|nr:diaminopimelate decarboxylase [Lachnospiraceae bacterium]
MAFICDNIGVDNEGVLTFAGQNTVRLAEKYGTPLMLLDECKIREKCRIYVEAFRKYFPEGSFPLYASKANSFKQIYRIMTETCMGIDVVSGGEIYTAAQAGFDLKKAYFHSNNKTDDEIGFAMDHGVGYFVADHKSELIEIQKQAESRGIFQNVLLRLTPGIDPHTYEEVVTGMIDSKFGTAIETGQADEIVEFALTLKNVRLKGFHCHVGSQVFAEDVFERAAVVMLGFCASMSRKFGYEAQELDLGGGFGVPYTINDSTLDIEEKIKSISETVYRTCEEEGIKPPVIHMEPGRSIVADAGMTLYTVGSVKHITGYRNYVSVDGGMTDNPRYALYKSRYTCYIANRMNEVKDMKCSLVGRCCESGDIVQPDIMLPGNTVKGDIAAVCTTGAYNYSMASNYNRVCRPAIVMLRDGDSYVAVRRETYEDICACDI